MFLYFRDLLHERMTVDDD